MAGVSAIALALASASTAHATHALMTHRDGYDFVYSDQLNSRGNAAVYSENVQAKGFTVGHLRTNTSALTAYQDMAALPLLYYSSGHSTYFNGGPKAGGFAAEFYWDGSSRGYLANNAAQTAEANLYADAFDITAGGITSMKLAVIQRCQTAWRDVDRTSTAHAFYRNDTGAATSIGFLEEVYFDLSATASRAGPDYTWAAEFWRQLKNGQRYGTAAQLANDKVVQTWGQSYNYYSWGIVGVNAAL